MHLPNPIFIIEYLNEGEPRDFQRRPLSQMLPPGTWPFDCQQLIFCQNTPHQGLIPKPFFAIANDALGTIWHDFDEWLFVAIGQ